MGRLRYGARGTTVTMDDRMLAHVQAVTVARLRRNEPFQLAWDEQVRHGSGRRAIWMAPSVELLWEFDGGSEPELDRELLETMMQKAGSTAGLHVDHHAHVSSL
ncbi:ATP-dependent DNA ligase [Schumannella sp. 10F1B-5-1]|uniref:DUF7882 family protein n=1 Tax=Schumannella sp. 10F1B-5-1 TaxID=2590780 RepID=UPI0011329ED2|nr:ATP-dependent DNA ligase [Schumannella sp. 10F1B-5-1]